VWDDFFDLGENAYGGVEFEVDGSGAVSALTSRTGNCTNYLVEKLKTCNE